jgi:hypothetical protein
VSNDLKKFLDSKVKQYNTPAFIKDDPICIPHLFTKKQDIEIAGLFAVRLCLGQQDNHYQQNKGTDATHG